MTLCSTRSASYSPFKRESLVHVSWEDHQITEVSLESRVVKACLLHRARWRPQQEVMFSTLLTFSFRWLQKSPPELLQGWIQTFWNTIVVPLLSPAWEPDIDWCHYDVSAFDITGPKLSASTFMSCWPQLLTAGLILCIRLVGLLVLH